MPHQEKFTPKPHAFPRMFGQLPLTKVRDYASSIKVDLVKHDDPVKMIDGTYDFVKATWSEDGRESERDSYEDKLEALNQMLAGKTLQLGLETVSFIFRISGITRLDTHQIVRQRVGVTFSQQCSGDQFWNHHDILLEPSIHYAQSAIVSHFAVTSALMAKVAYQTLLDGMDVSVQAARSVLPHCLDTFIFMKVDLATLLFFHQKRIDDGSQTWQMNEIAQQMADEVIKVFPALSETFEKNKTRFKFQIEASKDRKNSFSTGLYLPNPDLFDYHDQDFLYPKTKNEMHLVKEHRRDEFPVKFYWGMKEISVLEYHEISLAYDALSRQAEREHWSNEKLMLETCKYNEEYELLIGN